MGTVNRSLRQPPTFDRWLEVIPGAERVSETSAVAPCPNPEHEDGHPSFGFSVGQKYPVVGNCFTCDDWSGVKAGLEQLGLSTVGVARSTRKPRSKGPKLAPSVAPIRPKPLENQDAPHEWHAALMAHPESEAYLFLTVSRGLSRKTLERFKIGFDGQRVTIPIRLSGGSRWINVRRYLIGAGDRSDKVVSLPGYGGVVLAFAEVLESNSLPVLVCEGELDCLLANQIGEGEFVAVTGTGGAPNPPKDLSALANRAVFIAYDADDAGRRGAEKFAAALRSLT